MPFTPVATLDPERLKIAAQTLCDSTFLDVPTCGGKTIAFWFALFYHWQPGNTAKECQKITLLVGPLVGLLEDQAKTLNEKGVPAAAITSKSKNIEQLLTDLGNNKFRVGLVGPEMALSTPFHKKVLNNILFTDNIITLVIDETHCICEWGGYDFRPEYRKIVQLAARLPAGTPILAATATAPHDVIKDIMEYLALGDDTTRVQVSNEKLNVSLVVRILQEEPESFADLITIFPDDFQKPEDFGQSLFYVNGHPKIFEFYHKDIEDGRKTSIQTGLNDGTMRGVPATDALGLGMDFRAIMRVFLWMPPRTFLSLIQKIGRCIRDHSKRGVAVLYITKAMYARCCTELDIMRREDDENSSESDPEEEPEDEEETGAQADRDAAAAAQDRESDDEETAPAPKRRKLRHHRMSALERRDLRYLLEYIVTEGCRRIPWNKFFGNKDKKRLVENVVLVGGQNLKTGRKEKSSPELEAAVRDKLNVVRDQIVADVYPNQHFLTGNVILADGIIDTMAKRARLITSVDTLLQQTRWGQATRIGETIVKAILVSRHRYTWRGQLQTKAIQDVVILFPDHAKVAREREAAERTQRTLDADAAKELRNRLLIVFNGCYDAVFSQRESVPPWTRKTKKPKELRQICKRFLQLPKSMQHFPDYYVHIKNPISMLRIKAWSQKPTYYQTLHEYRHD
ncbi:P-loop containing nucleoside triphosphate hydrolase protein [Mycena leptocephala]|nr:P-loop containing nucleoside triphosphate hydrolase protein [Mycena leptocephala]